MHGSSHTSEPVAGFVDILHRTHNFPTFLSGKPCMMLCCSLLLLTYRMLFTDSEQGHCCCAVMENCLIFLFIFILFFAYVGITVVADYWQINIGHTLYKFTAVAVLYCLVFAAIQISTHREEKMSSRPTLTGKCCLDKRIFITVTQLKDQRSKCWETKKGNLTWTMRLMRRASKETHTDGDCWRNPIRTLISTERILQNVK